MTSHLLVAISLVWTDARRHVRATLLPSRPVIIIGRVFRRARGRTSTVLQDSAAATGDEYSTTTTHHTLVACAPDSSERSRRRDPGPGTEQRRRELPLSVQGLSRPWPGGGCGGGPKPVPLSCSPYPLHVSGTTTRALYFPRTYFCPCTDGLLYKTHLR